MATYIEMLDCVASDPLRQKVLVACLVAAEKIRTELPATTNHVARMAWAKSAFLNPEAEAQRMVRTVVVQNMLQTAAVIKGATDAQVQLAVDAAVDGFAT